MQINTPHYLGRIFFIKNDYPDTKKVFGKPKTSIIAKDGGCGKTRTCDPYDVNVIL